MLKNTIKKSIRIRPVHMLTILFLLFIVYVGLAAFPQLLINTGEAFQIRQSARSYIKQTNDQYSGMLETWSEYPLLQNKGTYINLNGLIAKSLRQPLMNDRVMLKNGHLFNIVSEHPDPEKIHHAATNIINFHNAHTAAGGDFLFVMVPSQISKYEDLLPEGYTDTTNATADTFLSLLEQEGVPYLDLREEMHNQGISITDAYFVTDHHWKPQTGFWAFGEMLKKLELMGAIGPVDSFYTNPENFTFATYENTFLGSSGKRTGIYYAGLDDSIFIQPKFETDISIYIPERELELQGRYEEVAYYNKSWPNFSDPDFYQENAYGLYGWGDMAITHWRNDQAPENGKFLLIGESFGNIPFSLMSIYLSSCDEVDMRHFKNDFSVYYDDYKPDTVIILFSIRSVISDFTERSYLGE